MSITNLYIDQFYVEDEISAVNVLNGQDDLHGDVSKNKAHKWIIQITNGSSSVIDFSSTNMKLTVCTNYKNGDSEDEDYDVDYNVTSSTLAVDSSYYIGWSGITGAPSINSSTTNYLADQRDGSGNIIVYTRFRLYLGGTEIDRLGPTPNNNWDGTNLYFLNSPTYRTGSFPCSARLKTSVNAPTTIYNASNWNFTAGGIGDLSASAAGDPHICTLFGNHYEFDHLGCIRLFDNQHVREGDENDLIVINGLVEPGPGRWSEKQYIRKLFIYNAGQTMLVDLGFRGSKVTVEYNNGIKYHEEELEIHPEAKRYSFNSGYRTTDRNEPVTADLPALVRNQISFELCGSEADTKAHKVELNVTLQNVNEYNLQPCRLAISTGNDPVDRERASGCIVHRKYATHCALDKIDDISDLPEPTEEEMKNMPELEVAPKLRNIKWK